MLDPSSRPFATVAWVLLVQWLLSSMVRQSVKVKTMWSLLKAAPGAVIAVKLVSSSEPATTLF